MATTKQKRRRKLLVFTVIGLVLVGLSVWAFFFRNREVLITVQTEKTSRRNLTELVVANGRIMPVRQVKISPEVSGEIIALPVKEGQKVNQGDLLVKIKPDYYSAAKRSAEASFKSALAGLELSLADLKKTELDCKRNEELFRTKLISEASYDDCNTANEIAKARYKSSEHQIEVAKAYLARAEEDLNKTTISSPITGTISKLNCEPGERVVGTAMMSGTEIMIVADLNEMEARVDIGEMDVVLIGPRQKARLEVDAFRDRKFNGTVTEIANSSKTASMSGQGQDATRFEVKIRIAEKEIFRPGMSVTAEIETRSRTNVVSVPIQSVTTRLPKPKPGDKKKGTNTVAKSYAANTAGQAADISGSSTNISGSSTNISGSSTNISGSNTNVSGSSTNKSAKKSNEPPKPLEVVFVKEGDHVKMVPIKRGISDENYTEITEGLDEGAEIIAGGYKAISRDLEEGKKIRIGTPEMDKDKEKDKR
jgi:HlyD family secretion protein